jgi:predicted nuclease of predicted toxin-antitoxin system
MSQPRPGFLVDHNVGQGVAMDLIQSGYDAIYVGDVDPHMSDSSILEWAVRERRIVITQDHDFGMLVFHSGRPHAGVVLLRMGEARRAARIAVVRWILAHYAISLPDRFCVFENGRLRIR